MRTAKLRPGGPGGPLSSTSAKCMSVRLGQTERSVWLPWPQPQSPLSLAHLRSAASTPRSRGQIPDWGQPGQRLPCVGVGGAKGQSPRTVRGVLPSAAASGPLSRKPLGCVAIVTQRLWKWEPGLGTPGVSAGLLWFLGSPTDPHLEAPGCIQSVDVLTAPEGPPGHKHGMVLAV